jgi:peptidoglycan-N-acetylglucosamine deacetylase
MMMLDRLITRFKQHEDVRFTTMLDHAQHWRSANPLAAWKNSGAPQAQSSCGRDGL